MGGSCAIIFESCYLFYKLFNTENSRCMFIFESCYLFYKLFNTENSRCMFIFESCYLLKILPHVIYPLYGTTRPEKIFGIGMILAREKITSINRAKSQYFFDCRVYLSVSTPGDCRYRNKTMININIYIDYAPAGFFRSSKYFFCSA